MKEELNDCSGCTDRYSEGTHQMHTVQHPCKEGGDKHCGLCFPEIMKMNKEQLDAFMGHSSTEKNYMQVGCPKCGNRNTPHICPESFDSSTTPEVGKFEGMKQIEKAIFALYKIVAVANPVTEDQVTTARFMLDNYEKQKASDYVRHLQETIDALNDALSNQKQEMAKIVKGVIDQKRAILWHPDIKKHTQRIARENTLNEVEADILSALELE